MVDAATPPPNNVAGYDYKADPFYKSATSETQGMMDKQHQNELYNQALGETGKEWLKGRDPYYQALRQQTYQAQAPQIQQQYNDALKAQSLQAAGQGLRGGSQDVYAKNRLATTENAQLSKADLLAQQAAQEAQMQDQQFVNQWLQFVQGQGMDTLNQYANAQQGSINDQSAITRAFQTFQMQSEDAAQNMYNSRSQMYGGMIGDLGANIQAAAKIAGAGGL